MDNLRKEGKSFYWASFFLPNATKKNAAILYSICRYFDDIADKNQDDSSSFLKKSIENIKYDSKNTINIFLKKHEINILIFQDLIDGLIKDQKKVKLQNKQELIKYSYQVAGTVGLMMSKIICVNNKNANSSAVDLGIAMQLTNIARDVYEDAKMNRIYLPREWIPNITLSMLNGKDRLEKKYEDIICRGIHRLIELSDKFYLNGYAGLKYIPFRTRLAIFIAANIYRGISIKIKNKGNKYLQDRIYLNTSEKILITLKSLFIFIFLPFLNLKYIRIRETLKNENL